jgi:hypothetical protein
MGNPTILSEEQEVTVSLHHFGLEQTHWTTERKEGYEIVVNIAYRSLLGDPLQVGLILSTSEGVVAPNLGDPSYDEQYPYLGQAALGLQRPVQAGQQPYDCGWGQTGILHSIGSTNQNINRFWGELRFPWTAPGVDPNATSSRPLVISAAISNSQSRTFVKSITIPEYVTGAGATCDSFCKDLQRGCKGGNEQFLSYLDCVTVCTAFPSASDGAFGIDYFECRNQALIAGLKEPVSANLAPGCAGSGIAASSTCGTTCHIYCDLFFSTCSAQALTDWSNHTQCLADCQSFTSVNNVGDSVLTRASRLEERGDNLQCRMHFLLQKLKTADSSMCESAKKVPSKHCTRCDSFCYELMDKCFGENIQYSSYQECMNVCHDLEDQNPTALTCRENKLANEITYFDQSKCSELGKRLVGDCHNAFFDFFLRQLLFQLRGMWTGS